MGYRWLVVEFKSKSFEYSGDGASALDRVIRDQFAGASWAAVRKLISSNKVVINGKACGDPRVTLRAGDVVELNMAAPRRGSAAAPDPLIEFVDADVVVVRKPIGIASERHKNESRNLEDVVRETLRRTGTRSSGRLRVVHRLDKVTSGLIVFARNDIAQKHLKEQFRAHTTGRRYVALAHGRVEAQSIDYRLVRNRGDGIRGTTSDAVQGYHAVTHVKPLEYYRDCTLVECRLETGRTHQIRIHLAARWSPVVGDPIYTKGFEGELLECSRTLLHAQSLAFDHPTQSRRLKFEQALPKDFEDYLLGLVRASGAPDAGGAPQQISGERESEGGPRGRSDRGRARRRT